MAFFDPVRPAYQQDPYPALARLRTQEPVHRSAALDAWVVTSYDLCDQILHDDESFSSDPINAGGQMGASIAATRSAVPLGSSPILGNSDAPVHTRIRSIMNRAFTPRAMAAIEPQIARLAAEFVSGLADSPELMSGFIEPFVVFTVLEQLGIPANDRAAFRQHARQVLAARSEGPARMAEAAQAHDALSRLLEGWRWDGSVAEDSVLRTLLDAAEGEQLTPDAMLMTLIHISSAGNGPTACAIGNAVLSLAMFQEQLAQLIAQPQALPSAVEETFRFDSATHMVARFARQPAQFAGRTIRSGDVVYVVIGAANRDPARFSEPDRFDITRTDNRHLSFGIGIHFCLGAPLARIMLRVAISALMDRFGQFRITSMQRGGTLLLRGPARLVIAPG